MPATDLVLFVCEHGSAKSLIAAEHFARLAAERGLLLRAASAGVSPDEAVPQNVVVGLALDGIDVSNRKPMTFVPALLDGARHVISFGCPLPATTAAVERWDDLPMVSDGYEAARSAIVARVETLLARLEPHRT